MNRILLGALAALMLFAAGLFWWQGRAATDMGPPLPTALPEVADTGLPDVTGAGQRGPELPQISEVTREQRRFDRIDRDRNGKVTREEVLIPRVAMFRKLDSDGNNLLSFEEWATVTSSRFKAADGNRDGTLDRVEFATTRPRNAKHPACACVPARRSRPVRQPANSPAPVDPEPVPSDDGFGPVS